jgi:hypothetical protein
MSLKLDQNGFKNQLPHWIKPGARPKLWKSRGMTFGCITLTVKKIIKKNFF